DAFEEARVGRHDVFELAVLRASLLHEDLAALFVNLRPDLAGVRVHQSLKRRLATDDRVADFLDAARAQGVGLAREAERRRCALVGFQKRPRRPLGPDGLAFGQARVEGLEDLPRNVRQTRNQPGCFHAAEATLLRLAAAKIITEQKTSPSRRGLRRA